MLANSELFSYIIFHLIDCKLREQILLTKITSSKNTKQNCYLGRSGKTETS